MDNIAIRHELLCILCSARILYKAGQINGTEFMALVDVATDNLLEVLDADIDAEYGR